ncbi:MULTISPECIES: hypothetical protein [Candidatus Ichthyocystis]|uniref:Lipoprotein n=1 Tax=Candidatus Ichthyocystis hellenicum TaxID=1561003 RepID=A0A0S4M4X9_9BURK|nr:MULTISPECIES: hypothetical protein [Ichthyocystis]CUT18111.1 hypothetical protein Ark11_1307 [Candidatus Ichthyocystis hellenicum]
MFTAKNSAVIAMILGVVLLSGCLDDRVDDDVDDNYIGSITIDSADTYPIGLTRDMTNNLISTAVGKERKGDIWSAPYGSGEMDRKTIVDYPTSDRYPLSGSYFDDSGNYLYACSNPRLSTVAPSIVIFHREDSGSYKWINSTNFDDKAKHCHSVTRIQNYVFATNSVSGDSDPNLSTAVYYADTADLTSIAPMKGLITYREFGYTPEQLTGENLITDIKAEKHQIAGKPSFYTVDSRNSLIFKVLVTGSSTKVVNPISMNLPNGIPTAIAQYSDRIFIISQSDHNKNSKGTIYKVKFDDNSPPKTTVIATTPSKVQSLVIGSDYFGKTRNPVVFALNKEVNESGVFHIDEFTFEEKNPA